MPYRNLTGIVLRSHDIGEKDRILVMLTPDLGKQRIVAKGSRRPGSRFAALDALVEADVSVYVGRNLHTLNQAVIKTTHRRVRDQLDRLAYGLFMTELVDLFTMDGESQPMTYELLTQGLSHLEATSSPEVLLAWFEVQLLKQMGLMPAWDACASCQGGDRPLVVLDPEAGGLVCPSCVRKGRSYVLPDASRNLLQYLTQGNWEDYGQKTSVALALPALGAALEVFIFYHLEGRPKSYDFLKSLRS